MIYPAIFTCLNYEIVNESKKAVRVIYKNALFVQKKVINDKKYFFSLL